MAATLAPPPIILTGRKLTGGALRFAFTNTPGASFTMVATPHLWLSSSNWTVPGGDWAAEPLSQTGVALARTD